MPGVVVEKHELNTIENVDVRLDLWDNGDLDLWIGETEITVGNLGDIVAFVEKHGAVTVVECDA